MLMRGASGTGDATIETPFVFGAVNNAAQASAAICIAKQCLSLSAEPAESSLKMLVNAPILFVCDCD